MTPSIIAGAGLLLAASLLPLVGVFAPLGATPLFMLTVLTCLPLAWRQRCWTRWPPLAIVPAFALCAWSAMSALWAVNAYEALSGSAKLAFTIIGGLVLTSAAVRLEVVWQRRILWALLVSVTLAAILLTGEFCFDRIVSATVASWKQQVLIGRKSPLSRGLVILILSGFAAMALLSAKRLRVAMVVTMTAIAVVTLLSDSLSARLAISVALVVVALGFWRSRLVVRILAGMVVVLWVAMPVVASRIPDPHYTFQNWTWIPLSNHHRTTIWSFAGQRIAEHPILGWGMEASRNIPGGDDEVQLWRYTTDGQRTDYGIIEAMLPLHPHNGVLQIWLELGMIGAVLSATLMLSILRRIGGLRDPSMTAILSGQFVVALIVGCLLYGVWQSWWQSALWLSVALASTGMANNTQSTT